MANSAVYYIDLSHRAFAEAYPQREIADPYHGIARKLLGPAYRNIGYFYKHIAVEHLKKNVRSIHDDQQNDYRFKDPAYDIRHFVEDKVCLFQGFHG